jgi:hypothetical protein
MTGSLDAGGVTTRTYGAGRLDSGCPRKKNSRRLIRRAIASGDADSSLDQTICIETIKCRLILRPALIT